MMHSASPATPLLEDERLDEVNEQIRLIQKTKGLTFGTDAFLLASYIRHAPSATAVELGGGTGIVSLLLAARKKLGHIHVVEIQPAFAELIERNVALNGLSDQISPLCADVRALKPAQFGGEVDLVFSNPPYMRIDSGKRNEEDQKFIARHEVCGKIHDFCATASKLLRYGGKFVCVWRPDRLSELFAALHNATLEPKRMTMVHADSQSEPCMLLLEATKGAAPSMRISPPLMLYHDRQEGEAKRILTDQAKKIYDTCSF